MRYACLQANSHDAKISFSSLNQKSLRAEFSWEKYLFSEQVNKCTNGGTFGNSSNSSTTESRTLSRSSAKAWSLPKGFIALPPWKRNFFHRCLEAADCRCSWQRPRLVVSFEALGYHLPARDCSYQRGFAGEAQKPSPGPSHPVTAHGEFVPAKLSLNHPFC